jgi:hypothetical protein
MLKPHQAPPSLGAGAPNRGARSTDRVPFDTGEQK